MNKYTPIVLITANSSDVNALDLKKCGIDFCLQKPIEEQQLLTKILWSADNARDSVIDWSICLHKVSGNQALAEEFLAKFVEELTKNQKDFLQFKQQKNIKSIGDLAHQLHGACCFCGVPLLQKKVIQLEKLALRVHHIEELSSVFSDLMQHIADVITEYEHHYQK
jgi:two-component system sensor histidine kinase BarA